MGDYIIGGSPSPHIPLPQVPKLHLGEAATSRSNAARGLLSSPSPPRQQRAKLGQERIPVDSSKLQRCRPYATSGGQRRRCLVHPLSLGFPIHRKQVDSLIDFGTQMASEKGGPVSAGLRVHAIKVL